MSSVARQALTGNGFAFETVTVTGSVVTLTTATYGAGDAASAHIRAVITATGGMMRYRYDSGNPTTTAGHLLSHGDLLVVEGRINVSNFRVTKVGGSSGTLAVTYERVY